MKNNYPIKYALIPIKKYNDFCNEDNINTYIVSKCFLINEIKKYLPTSSFKRDYQVVFPYQENEEGVWLRVEPEYGMNGEVVNATFVSEVFETFKEAKQAARLENEKIVMQQLAELSIGENMQQQIMTQSKIFQEKIIKYKELEALLQKYTEDLNVNEIPKDQNIIVMKDDKDEILKISLYDFINIYNDEPFLVCSVTPQEFTLMKKQIQEKGMLDERCPRITPNYNMFHYLIAIDIDQNMIKITDGSYQEEKGCFYLYNGFMYYDKNMYKFDKDPILGRKLGRRRKVYTTETYEDIIKSFLPKYMMDEEIKLESNTLCKKLILKDH